MGVNAVLFIVQKTGCSFFPCHQMFDLNLALIGLKKIFTNVLYAHMPRSDSGSFSDENYWSKQTGCGGFIFSLPLPACSLLHLWFLFPLPTV